jgi:hypothetical protein
MVTPRERTSEPTTERTIELMSTSTVTGRRWRRIADESRATLVIADV